jgi:poly(A) polymerase
MSEPARLDPQDWMRASATRRVIAALSVPEAMPRFVGGCVRDALAGRPVKDIDIATPLAPDAVMERLEAAGIKVVPTGLAHGTVTAVADHHPFEVTTLRVDVETDGRRAKVAFTDDWEADAARRDFTINALSCAPDGRLYDPFGGVADLKAGRIRFVGDAWARIREDFLRLLRYFRFHAHYGREALDSDTLAIVEQEAKELHRLSGERVRDEILKLLSAPDPLPALEIMIARGVLREVLIGSFDVAVLRALMRAEPADQTPDPLLRLAALLEPDLAIARGVATRLRLSNKQMSALVAWLDPKPLRDSGTPAHVHWRALRALGADLVEGRYRLDWARGHATGKAKPDAAFEVELTAALDLAAKSFPLRGADALKAGVPAGPRLGQLLEETEVWWAEGGFTAMRAECLRHLKNLAQAD